jgi:hypothetical protein
MTTFYRYRNKYAAHINSFLNRTADTVSHTDLQMFTNCQLTAWNILIIILIPAIRMKLSARLIKDNFVIFKF